MTAPLSSLTGQEFADYCGELDEQAAACDAGTAREDIIRRGEAAVAETDRRRGRR